jgi:hypothetical protein
MVRNGRVVFSPITIAMKEWPAICDGALKEAVRR